MPPIQDLNRPAEFEEELASIANEDEATLAQTRELERMYALEEQRNEERQRAGMAAKDLAKQKAQQLVKKQVTRSLLRATLPYWGSALAILLLIGGGVMLTVTSVAAICNSSVTQGVSVIAFKALVAAIPGDVCSELAFQGGRSGGAGGGASFGPGGDPNDPGCQDCVTLASVGLPVRSANVCSGSQPCQVESVVAQKLVSLNSSLSGWVITEAWPPTVTHQNRCHEAAMCVDANFTNPSEATAQNIINFITQASTAGLRAVYEVNSQTRASQLIAQGVPTSNIQVVTAITAAHFSIYN